MQNIQLQTLFQNLTPAKGPQPAAGGSVFGGGNEFESVLQGIIGAGNAGPGVLQQLSPAAQDAQSGNVGSDNMLAALLEKLTRLLEQQSQQAMSLEDLKALLEQSLSPEELGLLQLLTMDKGDDQPDALLKSLEDDMGTMTAAKQQALIDSMEKLAAQLNRIVDQTQLVQLQADSTLANDDSQKQSMQLVTMLTALKERMQQLTALMTCGQGSGNDQQTVKQLLAEILGGEQHNTAGPTSEQLASAQNTAENTAENNKTIEQLLQQINQKTAGQDSGSLKTDGQEYALQQQIDKNSAKQFAALNKNNELFNQMLQNRLAGEQGQVGKQLMQQLFTDLQQHSGQQTGGQQLLHSTVTGQQNLLNNAYMREALKGSGNPADKTKDMPLLQTGQALNLSDTAQLLDKVAAKEPVNPTCIIDSVTSKVANALRSGESRITLQLNPPSLGKLDINLSVRNNQLHAIILTESQHVKHVLEHNIDQLRSSLENQNIEIEKFSVAVGNGSQNQFASLLRDRAGKGKKQFGLPQADDDPMGLLNGMKIEPGAMLHGMSMGAGGLDLYG